jgi:hypothetical protein
VGSEEVRGEGEWNLSKAGFRLRPKVFRLKKLKMELAGRE